MPPKVRYSKEQIVEAGLEILRRDGEGALTARGIAACLGCSVAPIFSVFESMEDLKTAVVEKVKEEYDKYIAAGLKQELPFKGAGMQYIKFAKEQPNLFRILFMSESKKTNIDSYIRLDENNSKIISALCDSWHIDIATARELHNNIFFFTYGMAVLCATNACAFTEEEISCRLTTAFIALLKASKGDKND